MCGGIGKGNGYGSVDGKMGLYWCGRFLSYVKLGGASRIPCSELLDDDNSSDLAFFLPNLSKNAFRFIIPKIKKFRHNYINCLV